MSSTRISILCCGFIREANYSFCYSVKNVATDRNLWASQGNININIDITLINPDDPFVLTKIK